MSVTGRGAPPDKLGRYYTDPLLARCIVQRCVERRILRPGQTVLEPSSGGGAFLDAMAELGGTSLYAMDVSPTAPTMHASGAVYHREIGDFLTDYPDRWPNQVDVVIGNPPYSVTPEGSKRPVDAATGHCREALDRSRRHVVFLLRAGFLGMPKNGIRRRLFVEFPPREVWQIWPRPSFTGGGTDASEYVIVWWDLAYIEQASIEKLDVVTTWSPLEWLDDWRA